MKILLYYFYLIVVVEIQKVSFNNNIIIIYAVQVFYVCHKQYEYLMESDSALNNNGLHLYGEFTNIETLVSKYTSFSFARNCINTYRLIHFISVMINSVLTKLKSLIA